MNRHTRRSASGTLALSALFLAAPLEAAGPYRFNTLTPCRLADTRNLAGPSGGPALVDGLDRAFPVQGLCGVPDGATAVTVNVTAVNPTGLGHLRLYPSGQARPTISTLNYNASEPAIGNGAIVALGPSSSADLTVFSRVSGGGTVHMVLDVTGYFTVIAP